MEEDFIELEKQQRDLVNDFISNNNMIAFKRIFNTRTMPKAKKSFFLSEGYLKPSEVIKRFRANHRIMYNSIKTTESEENYKLNRYNFIEDPENKDKNMKGNYKWASQRFQMMKRNWAKRKGIPYKEFQVPKIISPVIKTSKEINGNLLAQSMQIKLPKI